MLNKKTIAFGFSVIALGSIISGVYFYSLSNPLSGHNATENTTIDLANSNPNHLINKNTDSHIINAEDAIILQDQQAIRTLIAQLDRIHQQIDIDKQHWHNQTLSGNHSSHHTPQALFNIMSTEPEELTNYGKQYAEWLVPQALVSFGEDWLNKVHIGKQFALPTIQNTETDYVAHVTHKTELWNGDYLIKAMVHKAKLNDHAKTEQNALPLLIAMNTETSSAYISYSTYDGSYEAELKNGFGELYAVNELDRATENGKYDDVIHEVHDIRHIHHH